ncbi:lymphocyte cytosolic protein 2-like [Prorops nasuta]|uniref:lymphocyte cytosolic protein 2-like n=1 Tax=Prorops nasuta TaxID=863751 RepID=UPI0034CDF2D4
MSEKLSRSDAIGNISTWNTNRVLLLLQKNGLEDCCQAVKKRQIDGDELLYLTEGKLALWKNDLTRQLMWKFWSFLEELKKSPEKYLEETREERREEIREEIREETMEGAREVTKEKTKEETEEETREESKVDVELDNYPSDNEYWDTDFEDSTEDEIPKIEKICQNNELNYLENQVNMVGESIYVNCGNEEDNTYANFNNDKHLPIEQRLELMQLSNSGKPAIKPKPEVLKTKKISNTNFEKAIPQISFLHNAQKIDNKIKKTNNEMHKRMSVPPPPDPKQKSSLVKPIIYNPECIRSPDLVANLPTKMDESEDDYEPFDNEIIEQNQKKMGRTESKLSLGSGNRSSVESIYKPPSNYDEDDETYKIYESITESPDDKRNYLSYSPSLQDRRPPSRPPLPLVKPPLKSQSPTPSVSSKTSPTSKERTPDKKSATLPHSSSNTSLSSERATRPLPPPPTRSNCREQSWFHNLNRDQAAALIQERPQNGYFLVRPSRYYVNRPFTLVLWFQDRVYNVPVRRRADNRFALGTVKVNERSFASVEEMVSFYSREELFLNSGGVPTGKTKLTDSPPKATSP